jgi:hypothetical protein
MRRGIALVVVFGVGFTPAAGASTATVGAPQPVSDRSQFVGPCPGFPPITHQDAEAEPTLAVNPRDPNKIALAWVQDAFTQPAVATSSDGGRSFRSAVLSGATTCSGGTDSFSLDPWLSFGPDGTAYLVVGAGDIVGEPVFSPRSRVLSYRSTHAGTEWQGPVVVEPKDGSFYDKPSITADPRHPGRAYAVYARRTGPAADSTGLSYVRRTDDAGASYSERSALYEPGSQQFTDASIVVVLADGTLVDVFIVGRFGQSPLQMSQRSTDDGRTWSPPALVGEISTVGVADPDTTEAVQADPLPTIAADGQTVYVAWHEVSSAHSSRIALAKSTDGARRWSAPTAAIDVAGQAFLPTLAVAHDGTVALTWYDTRGDRSGDGQLTTDYRFAHSHDGGRTWEQSHVGGPFDMRSAATAIGGHFIGDYFGLAAVPGGFVTAFTLAQPLARAGPSDIFLARIHVPAAPRSKPQPRRRRVSNRHRRRRGK